MKNTFDFLYKIISFQLLSNLEISFFDNLFHRLISITNSTTSKDFFLLPAVLLSKLSQGNHNIFIILNNLINDISSIKTLLGYITFTSKKFIHFIIQISHTSQYIFCNFYAKLIWIQERKITSCLVGVE